METQIIEPPTNTTISKPNKVTPTAEQLLKHGYLFLFLSFSFYCVSEYFIVKDTAFLIFFIHYLIAITYTVILLANGALGIRKSWKRKNLSKTVVLLNLYLISAYALNRELSVFANATDWLCVYLILASLTTLSFHYHDKLPKSVNKIQYVLMGAAFALYTYLTLYVANFYIIGGIGLIALGIGGHILVPVFLVSACVAICLQYRKQPSTFYWIAGGLIIPIALAVAFIAEWNSRLTQIETYANQSVMFNNKTELPLWVNIAQTIKNDWISQRILKSDLVYTIANDRFSDWDFMPKSISWDEVKKHDPLVFLASLFKKTSLTSEDRVKILKAISEGRHQANERLWSGDNLTTAYIVSDVDIYPDLRLAYTEKYLNVKNNSAQGNWWGNTEEGIYTFYLPEGSVVTSLSLWINGKEEKAILTSKQKATNAYNTIVGVERHDPSVVHWQEGNTVTVRVFPCTRNEERKVKIGVTSPLQEEGGRVVYKNITFRGPDFQDAKETTRIRFITAPKDLNLDPSYKTDRNYDYISEHKYNPDFELSFKTMPIKQNAFWFEGYSYSVQAITPTLRTRAFTELYLDINDSWNEHELDELKPSMNSYTMYVYDNGVKIKLDYKNWHLITDEMRSYNFSLFPFHRLKNTETSLVITKGKVVSPHLSDVQESGFAEEIGKFFTTGKKINVFQLQGTKSTYVSSLRELRAFEFANGNTKTLLQLLSDKKFPETMESDDQIVLHDAGMSIIRTKQEQGAVANNAPDHLTRLFFYNDIMRKVGVNYFGNDFSNKELVDEAATAYVVSPVSSLIVLETQQDYKRFDIEDKENSLHNATNQSSGAVPEPHEWALIILFALFVLYLKLRA